MRLDREWYKENAPARRTAKSKPARYDWEKRDQEYTSQAEQIASEMYNSPERPSRVTVFQLNCFIFQLNCPFSNLIVIGQNKFIGITNFQILKGITIYL